MITGKARVTHTRRVNQLRFEEFLIDDFAHGQPPDPSERRVIPVVYGALRLTAPVLDREIICVQSIDQPELFAPGVDDSAVHPTLIPPRVEAPTAPPTASAEPGREKAPPVLKRVPDVPPRRPSIPVTPPFATRHAGGREARSHRSKGTEFRWKGFFFGAAMGGLAGAAVLAIVSAL